MRLEAILHGKTDCRVPWAIGLGVDMTIYDNFRTPRQWTQEHLSQRNVNSLGANFPTKLHRIPCGSYALSLWVQGMTPGFRSVRYTYIYVRMTSGASSRTENERASDSKGFAPRFGVAWVSMQTRCGSPLSCGDATHATQCRDRAFGGSRAAIQVPKATTWTPPIVTCMHARVGSNVIEENADWAIKPLGDFEVKD